MLQPLEELQDCNAKADKSIDTDYSSLPPQLVVFQALKSKHFVLAAVCAMALLANVLAVAFAGLFNQASMDINHATTFQAPYDFKFVPINGSVGPRDDSEFGSLLSSGAYKGGDGQDQFLIAESNFTQNTSLPAWTDDKMFYMPLFSDGATVDQTNTTQFEATTKAFGAALDCEQLELGKNFEASIIKETVSLNISIPSGSGTVRCSNKNLLQFSVCVDYPSAHELVVQLAARQNATQHETDVCMSSVVLGWMREPQGLCPQNVFWNVRKNNTLFVHCRPRLMAGSAKVRVDASGRLKSPADIISLDRNVTDNSSGLFSNDPTNLIGQSNLFLFRARAVWHNDSFASDHMNYFTIRASNNYTRLVDPRQPVPKLEDVLDPINKAYSKLFAIWLGRNNKNLFVPMKGEATPTIEGSRLERERRIFLSRTMFIISEAILCTYVLVAIWVYARRPGRYLARLPTSIASVIALFAASAAVEDMQGASHLDRKGRAQHLKHLDSRYGFGSFIGGRDGRVHIGIEKVPLVVKPRAKMTWLEQKVPLLRRPTWGLA